MIFLRNLLKCWSSWPYMHVFLWKQLWQWCSRISLCFSPLKCWSSLLSLLKYWSLRFLLLWEICIDICSQNWHQLSSQKLLSYNFPLKFANILEFHAFYAYFHLKVVEMLKFQAFSTWFSLVALLKFHSFYRWFVVESVEAPWFLYRIELSWDFEFEGFFIPLKLVLKSLHYGCMLTFSAFLWIFCKFSCVFPLKLVEILSSY